MNTFTYGGIISSTYQCYVFDDSTMESSPRKYTYYDIPGRDGSLIIDENRYSNVGHSYKCVIFTDFDTNYTNLLNALYSKTGYNTLQDSFRADEYYKAVIKDAVKLTYAKDKSMGSFIIYFDRKPQRYLVSGDTATTFTADGTISNPTQMDSKPLLRIYGNGTVGIGGSSITVSNNSNNDLYVDCEMMEAYRGTNSMNANIVFANGYPKLHSGSNGITLGTGISKVIVTPKWWRL